MFASIWVLAFVGYAVYNYFGGQIFSNGTIAGVNTPGDSVNIGNKPIVDNGTDSTSTNGLAQQVAGSDEPANPSSNNHQPQTNTNNTSVANNQTGATSSPNNTVPTTNNSGLTEEKKAEYAKQYQEYIYSAQSKMDTGNFSGCREDLLKANEINKKADLKSSYEVDRMLGNCEEKEKERIIKDRLANYDTYNNYYGSLSIVRDKKTKLFGAIDAEGIERIPCKYVTFNRSSDTAPPEFQLAGEEVLVEIGRASCRERV